VFKVTSVIVNTNKLNLFVLTIQQWFFDSFQHYSVLRIVTTFSTRSLKTSIVSIGIEYTTYLPPQEEVARKLSGPEEHPAHFTIHQHNIHYSKINAPFSQNFSSNHRINTETPASYSWIKLTKNLILSSLPRPQNEKTLL
jgi:hypothetical protein